MYGRRYAAVLRRAVYLNTLLDRYWEILEQNTYNIKNQIKVTKLAQQLTLIRCR